MAVLFTDDFNRANGGLGASYTDLGVAMQVISNQCAGGAGAGLAYVNTVTVPTSAYIKVAASTVATSPQYNSLIVWIDTGTFNWYLCGWSSASGTIERADGGVPTVLATFAAPTSGQVVEFRRVGSSFSVYYDGVLAGSATDATYSSTGRAAVLGSDASGRLDNLVIGDLIGLPFQRRMARMSSHFR